MTLDEARRIAGLWRSGKLIGGDEDEVRNTLLAGLEQIEASCTSNVLDLIKTHGLLVRPSFTGNWRVGRFLGVTGHAMPRAYCEEGTEWEAETIEEAVSLCVSALSEGRVNPLYIEAKAAIELVKQR